MLKTILQLSACALLASGCVVRETRYHGGGAVVTETEVVVPQAPPAIQTEVVPVSPGPDYIWVGGSWGWHDRWVWEPGRWSRPPHRGARWYPGRYEHRNGHHVWIRGGWR